VLLWTRAVPKNLTPLETAPVRLIGCCPSVADPLPQVGEVPPRDLHTLGDQALGKTLADAARRLGDDWALLLRLAALDERGRFLGTCTIPTTAAGYSELVRWAGQ
jgi:hypothetical protein